MRIICCKRICWLSLIIFVCLHPAKAQKTVQVLTKTVTRTLNYEAGESLEILAEKATVDLEVWDKKQIGITLKLISKHQKKGIAERELQYLRYLIDEAEGNHTIKNFFLADESFKKVKGNLLIEYEVKVPRKCPVSIHNLYGKIKVHGLKNELNVFTRFVETSIKNCDGNVRVESFFGKTIVTGGSGKLTGDLKKSDIDVLEFEGEVEFESDYGAIQIEGDKLLALNARGNRTRIILLTTDPHAYNYKLNTSFSEIKFPNMIVENSEPAKNTFRKIFREGNPLISISTTYSPITIKQNYRASKK